MFRATRSTDILTVLFSVFIVLASASYAVSGPARPAPVDKVFVAMEDADPSSKSLLVFTPNRNCAKLVAVPSARIIKGGYTASFSSIEEGLQLHCKGVWDESTSPMSFRATQVRIGGRVMKKRPVVTHPRWRVPVDKSRKQTFSARPMSAAHTLRKETLATSQLELSEWKWKHDAASSVVSGRVKNLAKSAYPNVVGVVRYYTSSGSFVVSDMVVVGGNELGPGEACGFKLKTNWAPGYSPTVAKADIEFHCASGKLVLKRL